MLFKTFKNLCISKQLPLEEIKYVGGMYDFAIRAESSSTKPLIVTYLGDGIDNSTYKSFDGGTATIYFNDDVPPFKNYSIKDLKGRVLEVHLIHRNRRLKNNDVFLEKLSTHLETFLFYDGERKDFTERYTAEFISADWKPPRAMFNALAWTAAGPKRIEMKLEVCEQEYRQLEAIKYPTFSAEFRVVGATGWCVCGH